MNIQQKIQALLLANGDMSVKEMTDQLLVSKQAIHLAINKLLEKDLVEKFGRTPKTIYRGKVPSKSTQIISTNIDEKTIDYLNQQFLVITETGNMLSGVEGFNYWCKQRSLPLEKTIVEYIKTKEKYVAFYEKNGLINGLDKLLNTKGYKEIYLDNVYYLDFYAIERFGKTRLGTILHYAKQGQNKFLMKILVEESKEKIRLLLENSDIDAIGYVPPTIRREVQLMKFLENQLRINLPKINIQKISGIIPVPQKSLNKIEERINNAENTFSIPETVRFKHVLLLDDAIGSGSTLNQIAGKVKQKGIAQKVTGLAIVGSFKGFDVVTDV
jgi:DNA-binding transcriptional regulator GbsR (MarR family)